MKQVMKLRARGKLTEQQILTAGRFARNPNAFTLAPTLFRFLHDIIIKERGLEELEKSRGMPARSAKAMLSMLLFAIEEVDGFAWFGEGDEVNKEMIDFLKGEGDQDLLDVMCRLEVSQSLARVYLIILRSNGQVLSKEVIHRRLYDVRTDIECPSLKMVDVLICQLRKKLPDGEAIDTIHSVGYILRTDGINQRNSDWIARSQEGESFAAIARKCGISTSTVKRVIERHNEKQADVA